MAALRTPSSFYSKRIAAKPDNLKPAFPPYRTTYCTKINAMLQATSEVIRFEAKRTQTRSRLFIWLALALVPSGLLLMLQAQADGRIPPEALGLITFYLVAQIGCMLGLLLWATPVVGSELEAQTWLYIALRRDGKVSLLLGKYVVATLWTASAGIVSAIGVAWASQYPEPVALALCLCVLVCVGSLCYSALYMLMGILLPSRATVIAVVYTLVVEGLLSNIPATINQFTVCYRLRSIRVEWLDLSLITAELSDFIRFEPMWQHFIWLGLYVAIVLLASLWAIRTKEFPVNSDT